MVDIQSATLRIADEKRRKKIETAAAKYDGLPGCPLLRIGGHDKVV